MLDYARCWGRGVAVNMPACQAGDRGFKSRRSRQVETSQAVSPFCFWNSPAATMVFNSSIRYLDKRLTVDEVDIEAIIDEVGTPAYIYSLARIRRNVHRLRAAFAPVNARLHFSVKANGNLDVLRALSAAGAGFDCVSGGEIYRVLAGGRPGGRYRLRRCWQDAGGTGLCDQEWRRLDQCREPRRIGAY